MAAASLNSDLKRNASSPTGSSTPQSHGAEGENIRHNSGDVDANNSLGKNSSKSSCKKRKNANQTMRGSRYPLRSSNDGKRVLRSMSNGKSSASIGSSSASIGSYSAPSVLASTPIHQVTKIKRKKKQLKKTSDDEFTRIRKRVRYLLARMNYEQSLLDAYSGEGWKGQSLEKIRPEKELERAKSEILRCKLRIREVFRHLESLLSEGRLEESLFDDEGEISSEDITCAKCGSKDSAIDNDIILCDGTCDRGFHQKCLNPPLLSEDIPSDEVGWLCPACDCKVDCLDFLNEIQGIDLSVEDTWEKVFPEAAAIANGDLRHDDLGFPSDDSEDDDFNPDAPDIDVDNEKEGSSSEESSSEDSSSGESYYTCSSGHSDSGASNPKDSNTLELPSDDSEDDDYDPDGPDPEEMVHKDDLSLEESDFTSDSDEFMKEINKASDINEVSSSLPSHLNPPDLSGEDRQLKDKLKPSKNPVLLSILEPDINGENTFLVSGKRQRENLDYKKLYDETYGDASSDSSDDDDDWSGMTIAKKAKNVDTKADSVAFPKKNISKAYKGELTEVDTTIGAHVDQLQGPKKLDSGVANQSAVEHTESLDPDSSGNKGSAHEKLGIMDYATQRFVEVFTENQYPKRKTKENLAEELGKTVQQVSKWFVNARRSARTVAEETGGQAVLPTPTKSSGTTKIDTDSEKTTPKSGQTVFSTPTTSNGTIKSVTADSATNSRRTTRRSAGKRSNGGAENDMSNGVNDAKAIDDKRQKAIAQELRKRKKIR